MSEQHTFTSFYFLGIGGIGMSALARYFHALGRQVAGYDHTQSDLTLALQHEGMPVDYDDLTDRLPSWVNKDSTLIVWTPAVPRDTVLYRFFLANGFTIAKRSEVLGHITRRRRALCVAGTHGKTTTSTLIAHILSLTATGTNAFLGGISLNHHSNLLLAPDSPWVVAEADEFDRSFLHLTPARTVITAIDPDHLDIYGTAEGYQAGFDAYAALVQDSIVIKKSYHLHAAQCPVHTYSADEEADYFADHIRMESGRLFFDFHACATAERPAGVLEDMELGVPARFNVENAVAALALLWEEGIDEPTMRTGLSTYQGVHRRFNLRHNTPQVLYIDDYAHHPTELATALQAARFLAPDRYMIAVFQPHLYSRTRDFMSDFARVLGEADEVIVLPIYPARESPIEGISSDVLAERIGDKATVVSKQQLADYILSRLKTLNRPTTVMTLGAGDIDRLVQPLEQTLLSCR